MFYQAQHSVPPVGKEEKVAPLKPSAYGFRVGCLGYGDIEPGRELVRLQLTCHASGFEFIAHGIKIGDGRSGRCAFFAHYLVLHSSQFSYQLVVAATTVPPVEAGHAASFAKSAPTIDTVLSHRDEAVTVGTPACSLNDQQVSML